MYGLHIAGGCSSDDVLLLPTRRETAGKKGDEWPLNPSRAQDQANAKLRE